MNDEEFKLSIIRRMDKLEARIERIQAIAQEHREMLQEKQKK